SGVRVKDSRESGWRDHMPVPFRVATVYLPLDQETMAAEPTLNQSALPRQNTFAIYSLRWMGLNRRAVPDAWVVKCTGCGCTVNARAIDSQAEATEPGKAESAPRTAMMVTCACCWGSYRYPPGDAFKGTPRPNENCRYWKARVAAEKNGDTEQ